MVTVGPAKKLFLKVGAIVSDVLNSTTSMSRQALNGMKIRSQKYDSTILYVHMYFSTFLKIPSPSDPLYCQYKLSSI
jgi:hypothetical protein